MLPPLDSSSLFVISLTLFVDIISDIFEWQKIEGCFLFRHVTEIDYPSLGFSSNNHLSV